MKQVFFFRQGQDNKKFVATWNKIEHSGKPTVDLESGGFETMVYLMGASEVTLLYDLANDVAYSITLDYPETRGSLWRELNEQGYLQIGTVKLRQFYPTQRWMVEDLDVIMRTFDTMEKAFRAFCEYMEVMK